MTILDLQYILAILRESGNFGVMLFLATHVALALAGLPCSPLTLAAGILWGPVEGLAYSMFALLLSCAVTFCISYKIGARILNFLPEKISIKISDVLTQDFFSSWKAVVLFSANPIIPAASTGYIFGLTRISFATFISATVLAVLPLQLAYIYLGDSLIKSLEQKSLTKILIGVSLFAVLILLYKRNAHKK